MAERVDECVVEMLLMVPSMKMGFVLNGIVELSERVAYVSI